MKISKEVRSAILVISGLLILIYMYNYLKGENLFSSENEYYTEFDYNALSSSSMVTVKGNTVGKVKDIIYDFETGKTRVSFSVNPKLKFSKNSTIRLYETGVLGGNALSIIQANDNEFAQDGDFITSEVEQGLISSLSNNFSGLSTDLDHTLRSADTLLVSLNDLVVDNSELGLKNTIGEFNKTIKSFREASITLNGLIKNNQEKLNTTLTNVEGISSNLSSITDSLANVGFSKTIKGLQSTLNNFDKILVQIESGEGSASKLLKDDELYENLSGASKQMEELLEDIKLHPKRYFRILSRKEIPYEEEKN